ncbi:trichohyalin-like [Brachyistius frenatus]|uniref:trichohyalin-like n=1 Tax=Brachyistius frenatus TaxID=100188 RepID=UPI0037E97FBE
MADFRTGRSEARTNKREKLQSCGDIVQLCPAPPPRRAKSLDRRTSDTVMTPDLLNFKKGWMMKLDGNDQWKKYWFVLSTDSLRFYKDSIAEEASDLEGEIDLTKCFSVSEFQVQRNYGFQIHTPKGVFTLSAMTAGIRKNWIQALMKNVRPANAPDVASLPGHHVACSPPEVLPKPDVTRDSPSADVPSDRDPRPKPRSVTERRREGRYRTFDWAEFRPQRKPAADVDPPRTKPPCELELGELERRRRREERRRRYESMLGISLVGGGGEAGGQTEDSGVRALSPRTQQRVEEEVEECWRRVEQTAFRPDSTVPLFPEAGVATETETMLHGYRKGVEDLKVQLAESERLRLKLEAQLISAGFYQQQLDSESDFFPLDANENRLKDLKDTGELLLPEAVVGRDLREQLRGFQPPSAPQPPSIWLLDTEGNLQELEDLLPEGEASPSLSPASDGRLDLSPSDGEIIGLNQQNELRRDDRELFPASETQTKELILEPAGGDDSSPDRDVLRSLSQEVELLTGQNEALNQRNQEMLNQLTEADREIERLKAELSGRYAEPRHLPEAEQQGTTGPEDAETELRRRNRELLEARTLIASLEETLRETEALLQLSDPAGRTGDDEEDERSAEKAEGYLLRCFEATEAKLTELEGRLDQSERTCGELRRQNSELKEADELHLRRAGEAEADVRRLTEELEEERRRAGDGGKTRQVTEEMETRLRALGRLLEVIDTLGHETGNEEEEVGPAVVKQLKWEEEFWSSLLQKLKESEPADPVDALLGEATELLMLERRTMLAGHRLPPETDEGKHEALKDLDIVYSVTATETTKTDNFNELLRPRDVTRMKISLLRRVASSVGGSELRPAADRTHDRHFSERPVWLVHSAATEALYCCYLRRLQAKHERRLGDLREENRELKARLSNVEERGARKTETDTELSEERWEGSETPEEVKEETGEDEPSIGGMEISNVETAALRRRVEELEELLSVRADEMKEELDGEMSRAQHEKELEKLKVACEHGFARMEESHLKVVEELQRRHRQEVERLLVERDRLLEEESAATLTAIVAIKNAHREELQREVQRRCRSENNNGDAHLEDIHRQHSEELASYQRELQVLSQQFSLKCLENGHLVQAVDAERKALCQCQQENQDLRTRNQELSGHLAAEITRLCSLAKQNALPLSQGMDVYEMEITLRVKESEVQCLKQEITSLKDDLQAAQKDKRNATKKYKDIYTELSIMRAKAEREADELKENLRLAHRALGPTSP